MLQVVIKLAEHDISVSALSALRFGIAALCFAPSAVRGLRNKEMRLTALELGLWLFGAFQLIHNNNPNLHSQTQTRIQTRAQLRHV